MKSFSIYRKFDVDLPAFHVIAVTGNHQILLKSTSRKTKVVHKSTRTTLKACASIK